MLTLYKSIRGRIICGLASAVIAGLALGCLWFSSSVTAGDNPPRKKDDIPKDCPPTEHCPFRPSRQLRRTRT
jgi:hypothetical protein